MTTSGHPHVLILVFSVSVSVVLRLVVQNNLLFESCHNRCSNTSARHFIYDLATLKGTSISIRLDSNLSHLVNEVALLFEAPAS